jgi:hypothetical protein
LRTAPDKFRSVDVAVIAQAARFVVVPLLWVEAVNMVFRVIAVVVALKFAGE